MVEQVDSSRTPELVTDTSGYFYLPEAQTPALEGTAKAGAHGTVRLGNIQTENAESIPVAVKWGEKTQTEGHVLNKLGAISHSVRAIGRTEVDGEHALVMENVPYDLEMVCPSRANFVEIMTQVADVMKAVWDKGFTLRDFSFSGGKNDRIRFRDPRDIAIDVAITDWSTTGITTPETIKEDYEYYLEHLWHAIVNPGVIEPSQLNGLSEKLD